MAALLTERTVPSPEREMIWVTIYVVSHINYDIKHMPLIALHEIPRDFRWQFSLLQKLSYVKFLYNYHRFIA